jgi:hypothetical protein
LLYTSDFVYRPIPSFTNIIQSLSSRISTLYYSFWPHRNCLPELCTF